MDVQIDSYKAEDLVNIRLSVSDRLVNGYVLVTSYVTMSNPMYICFIWKK